MECKFSVGQKVVCVDTGGCTEFRKPLVVGAVYTISAVGVGFTGHVYVGLEETEGSGPLHWRAYRFRPVIDRKTNISIFTDMLTDTKAPVLGKETANV